MMTTLDFALFDTALGSCGIVWNESGIVGLQLPGANERATRDRVRRRYRTAQESTPPAEVQRAIGDIVALLDGEPRDLRYVRIDNTGIADFNRRVYETARTIPAGATLSYGEIAARLGDRNLARDVGEALGQNPIPIIVPCHRVLGSGGKTGGFSAPGGVATKLRLLSIEGAQPGGPTLFDRLPLVPPRRRAAAGRKPPSTQAAASCKSHLHDMVEGRPRR
jgi:methylated-DNA-[protein]-cysteine S-methyltransferase